MAVFELFSCETIEDLETTKVPRLSHGSATAALSKNEKSNPYYQVHLVQKRMISSLLSTFANLCLKTQVTKHGNSLEKLQIATVKARFQSVGGIGDECE